MLDADEGAARLVDRAQQLVQLGLHRRGVAILAVLDQEDDQEGDDGGAGVDHQLPGVGETEDGPGSRPDQDDQEGDDERRRLTDDRGDAPRKPGEKAVHHATNQR
jgi:hypothetical protein